MKNLKTKTYQYTVIDPINEQQTVRLIHQTNEFINFCGIRLDHQQAGELGGLLLALSDGKCDVDSIAELLDGYELDIPDCLNVEGD